MHLKLMYITNRTDVALAAEAEGVDRIFVDMEYIGKHLRQGGMDTVQSRHTVEDVKNIRRVLRSAKLLVRCNPIHGRTAEYCDSREEIEAVIAAGADIVMLPYFKTVDEVRTFLEIVNGRARTSLLLETPEAAEAADEILDLPGIDEVHIGLNDMSLGYRMKFMFELLADGTVEKLCRKCALRGIPYGFGGIASLGRGALPAEYVIKEHYRLGSGCVILSRSFCDAGKIGDIHRIKEVFRSGMKEIRDFEKTCLEHPETYEENRRQVVRLVNAFVGR